MSKSGWLKRVAGWVLLPAAAVVAQTPLGTGFTYQGQLKSGEIPANGLHDLRFRLFDAAVGGAQVGGIVCRDNVSVTEGLFTVSLDFGSSVFQGQRRFLEIDVRADTGLTCNDAGGYVTLSPRQEIAAAPYALFARSLSPDPPLVISGSSPGTAAIEAVNTSQALLATGIHGSSLSPDGAGVIGSVGPGVAGSFRTGVLGSNTLDSGAGVFGQANSASGSTAGVEGKVVSPDGIAVKGEAFGSGGGIGVRGEVFSSTGATIGVEGQVSSVAGTGVRGRVLGAGGIGVSGDASASAGATTGVDGRVSSPAGTGVRGRALATTGIGIGVRGECTSPSGIAGQFDNNGLGNSFDVELAGPNGAINTGGFVYREYTASVRGAAIPVAYGSIGAAGVIDGGTGNFTVAHTVTGEYDITIAGEPFSLNSFAVSITPLQNTTPFCGTAADPGTALRVNTWNVLTGVKADVRFHFIVFAVNPSAPG